MHQFRPDGLSLLNPTGIDTSRLLEVGQITDTYPLACTSKTGHGAPRASPHRSERGAKGGLAGPR